MRWLLVLLPLLLAACDQPAAVPPPVTLDGEAVGHYCGMTVAAHGGPKGQIHVAGRKEPYWFTSVRDTRAFTLLPEEPKDIRAIYVSDMAKAPSWQDPGRDNWMNAAAAVFVIGSRQMGGMGAPEAVPFSDRPAAERFAAEHGGRLVSWQDIPERYVLGGEAEAGHDH